MGYIGIANSMGILLAPLLGGVVYSHAGYYAVFALAFGLIAVDILLRLAIIEKRRADKIRTHIAQTDPEVLPEAGIHLPQIREPSLTTAHGGKSTLVSTNASIKQDNARKSPLKDLLTSRRFLISCWGVTVQAIILTAFDSVRCTTPLLNLANFDS